MTLEEFSMGIEKIFRLEIGRSNQHNQYFKFQDLEIRFKKKLYRDTCSNLTTLNSSEGYELYKDKSYEVFLTQGRRLYSPGIEDICKEDSVNKIKYCIAKPSNEFIVFFIQNLIQLAKTEDISRPFITHNLRRRISRGEYVEPIELFDVLKGVIPRFITLQISTEQNKSLSAFEGLCSSFLFTLGYNTDLSFLPSSITEDFRRAVRIGRLRRSEIEDIEPPKRKYQQDLILYYQKGISSDSSDLQFLSFYHILEHFFEKIYNEELLNSIRDKITTPSFSYKRNQDLSSLVKTIQNKLRYKNEEFQINEPEALRLVIDKFVLDFEIVKSEIETYDENLLEYYKTTEISFSKGNKVNFSDARETILKNLQQRIYRTRNSIVHSKDTDKSKYLPFKHDKELSKEIILMRILAEHIIIESSIEL